MRYTPEQYRNLIHTIEDALCEAELHNGRIINRLDLQTEDELIALHTAVQQKIHGAIHELDDVIKQLQGNY